MERLEAARRVLILCLPKPAPMEMLLACAEALLHQLAKIFSHQVLRIRLQLPGNVLVIVLIVQNKFQRILIKTLVTRV